MGKRKISKEKIRDGDSHNYVVKHKKTDQMQKKVDELNKRYPDNSYSIKESGNIIAIIRDKSKGRKPHKIKIKEVGTTNV